MHLFHPPWNFPGGARAARPQAYTLEGPAWARDLCDVHSARLRSVFHTLGPLRLWGHGHGAVLLALPLPGRFPSLLQSVWTPRPGSWALSLLRVNQEVSAGKGSACRRRVWVLRHPRHCHDTKAWAVAGSLCDQWHGPSAQPQRSRGSEDALPLQPQMQEGL